MLPILHGPAVAPFALDAYAVAILAAIGVGWTLTLRWAGHAGLPRGRVALATVLIGTVSLAGAHLHFVLNTGRPVLPPGRSLLGLLGGGAHAGGGILVLVVSAPLVARGLGLPGRRLADVCVPAAAASIVVARLGCLARGCCLGTVCAAPWCVVYPRRSVAFLLHADRGLVGADATASAAVHPLPLYFALAALGVAAVGRWLDPRRRYDGQVALVGLALFSASTWGLETFRADVPGRAYWGAVPQLTWTAAALTVGSLLALGVAEWWAWRSAREGPEEMRAAEGR